MIHIFILRATTLISNSPAQITLTYEYRLLTLFCHLWHICCSEDVQKGIQKTEESSAERVIQNPRNLYQGELK